MFFDVWLRGRSFGFVLDGLIFFFLVITMVLCLITMGFGGIAKTRSTGQDSTYSYASQIIRKVRE